MKIGIIGTGSIGGTLAKKIQQAGHDVKIANSKGVEGAQSFADEIGAHAVDIYGAVSNVDLIIVSIPFSAIADLPSDLFDNVPLDIPVVDTSNYYPDMRDPHIAEIDQGQVESLWVSEQLKRPVIKAFNNMLAYSLSQNGLPEGSSNRLALAVAGDDALSKKKVMDLVNDIGFDPVDAGSLQDSWRQQPSTPAYCCDWNVQEMKEALSDAVKGEAPKKRDKLPEYFASLGESPSHLEVIALNRAVNAPK